ncbi:MAG: hypothetical protein ACM3NQ_22130, partial [Bacteroidales bacterium]
MLAIQLGQRLIGVLLTLCGAALLVASLFFLLEDFRRVRLGSGFYVVRERARVAPVLFLVGAVPGLLLSTVQISAFLARGFDWGVDWRLLLWLIAALVPLLTGFLLWPIHRSEGFGRVSKVIALLSAAGVIGVGQNFLTSYYAPVRHGDSLSVTTQLA